MTDLTIEPIIMEQRPELLLNPHFRQAKLSCSIAPIIGIAVFRLVHILPEKIAKRKSIRRPTRFSACVITRRSRFHYAFGPAAFTSALAPAA